MNLEDVEKYAEFLARPRKLAEDYTTSKVYGTVLDAHVSHQSFSAQVIQGPIRTDLLMAIYCDDYNRIFTMAIPIGKGILIDSRKLHKRLIQLAEHTPIIDVNEILKD